MHFSTVVAFAALSISAVFTKPVAHRTNGAHKRQQPSPSPRPPTPACTLTDANDGPTFSPVEGFVSLDAATGTLKLNGDSFQFSSFNAPNLLNNDYSHYETVDTMLTLAGLWNPVTRIYTFSVAKNGNTDYSVITGWDASTQKWTFSETLLQQYDDVIAAAHTYGVRMIIPFVNQYNGAAKDYVGDIVDLWSMRFGVSYSDALAAGADVLFYTNADMIAAYKILIGQLLARVNTVNSIAWGNEEAILAWETGLELKGNLTLKTPPPGAWTASIAQFIKSVAPNQLVMDGTYSAIDFTADPSTAYSSEALTSPYVDLFNFRFYGIQGATSLAPFADYVRQERNGVRKAFVAVAYGLYTDVADYGVFLDSVKATNTAGALIWSLRQHSKLGGFTVHSEGSGMASFHAPGWNFANATALGFSLGEKEVVDDARNASFTLNNLEPASYPGPNRPTLLALSSELSTIQGAAWADHYELWDGCAKQLLRNDIYDHFPAGQFNFTNPAGVSTLVVRGVNPEGLPGPWSNVLTVA